MGKNNINGKTFLEKRYSEDLELEVIIIILQNQLQLQS
jgi:hypothetical protein